MYLNIGFQNYVNQNHIISIVEYNSAPIKRQVLAARYDESIIDAAKGKPVKSVIFTEDKIITSALKTETLIKRCK